MLPTFLALCLVLVALMLWSRAELSAFLARHPAVQGSTALEEYKQLVRHQMYGALAYLVLGGAGLLLGVYLAVTGGIAMAGIVIAVNVPMMFLGQSTKRLENRVRALACPDPQLASQFEHIGETWMRKALPDF